MWKVFQGSTRIACPPGESRIEYTDRLPSIHYSSNADIYESLSLVSYVYMQVVNHGLDYGDASLDAISLTNQIVLYSVDHVTLKIWEMEKERKLKEREYLDDGIRAAKEGDLVALRRYSLIGYLDILYSCSCTCIHRLVEVEGWDVHCVDRNGASALHWSSGEGHLEVCKYLVIERGVSLMELLGKKDIRRHPIHWCSRNGHVHVCRWLVDEMGIDPNLPTEDGTRPIHFAAFQNQMTIIRYLVEEAHCNVNEKNLFGCNTSQWLAINGNVDTMKYFKEKVSCHY
jgi:hypothetical protein